MPRYYGLNKMKYLIASDIHGSAFYCKEVLLAAENEKADKIILLGDVYNHGPRNALPKDYAPMKVAELLNGVKERLIVIKGNCDSEVDAMISEFDFLPGMCLALGNKLCFLTHGHVYNIDHAPKTKYDAVIYGHFHTGFIKEKDGVLYINAGSASIPKDNTKHSYLIADEKKITLKEIGGQVIDQRFL